MNPPVKVPEPMMQDIDIVLMAYTGRTMPLYAEADNIRRRWLSENIALEDILDLLVRRASVHNVSFEIDPSQAAEALRGPGAPE
jgi:hypothetical protein